MLNLTGKIELGAMFILGLYTSIMFFYFCSEKHYGSPFYISVIIGLPGMALYNYCQIKYFLGILDEDNVWSGTMVYEYISKIFIIGVSFLHIICTILLTKRDRDRALQIGYSMRE
jgi:hypothetical protein